MPEGIVPLRPTVVTRYRISLEQAHFASSAINLRLAAVRGLAYEASDLAPPSPVTPTRGWQRSGALDCAGAPLYTQSRYTCEMNPEFRNGGTAWLSNSARDSQTSPPR